MNYITTHRKPPLSFPSVSGAICTFNSQYAGLTLKSHEVAVSALQTGTGTPSPSNPRPIVIPSYIGVGNISDNSYITYFQGILNGTYGFVDMGTLNWGYGTDFGASIPTAKADGQSLCLKYERRTGTWSIPDKCYRVGTNVIRVRDDSYTSEQVAEFTAALEGVYLIYEYSTASTPSFTNAQFEALCNSFNIDGQGYIVQIGSSIYVGTYDAITGEFTGIHKGVDLGSLTWYSSQGFHYAIINDGKYASNTRPANAICEQYKVVAGSSFSSNNNAFCYGLNSLANLWVNDSNLNSLSASDFKTAMSGIKLLYELTTPVTLQLAPVRVETYSKNNVWASTGDTTLQYIKLG